MEDLTRRKARGREKSERQECSEGARECLGKRSKCGMERRGNKECMDGWSAESEKVCKNGRVTGKGRTRLRGRQE